MTYRKILLIDDDIEDREIFKSALYNIYLGIKINVVTNANIGLDTLINQLISVDLIFLDLNLLVMSVRRFLMNIKSIDKLKRSACNHTFYKLQSYCNFRNHEFWSF